MSERLRTILGRYGWRAPIVVMVLGLERLSMMRCAGFAVWLRLLTHGHKGRKIYFGRGIQVRPGCFLALGANSYIGDRCRFEIGIEPAGSIVVGANTWLSHDCHIHALGEMRIGRGVLVGEFVSIRDTTHRFSDPLCPIKGQGDVTASIVIEDGVWIGRGCLIQGKVPGITLGQGAVIGANSVITKSVPPMEVWAGAPARFIRARTSEQDKVSDSSFLE